MCYRFSRTQCLALKTLGARIVPVDNALKQPSTQRYSDDIKAKWAKGKNCAYGHANPVHILLFVYQSIRTKPF